MLSSNPLTYSYFALSISLTSSQNFHQCFHAYEQYEIPTRPLQRPLLLLIMKKKKKKKILIFFFFFFEKNFNFVDEKENRQKFF